jgi:hypothetical protein
MKKRLPYLLLLIVCISFVSHAQTDTIVAWTFSAGIDSLDILPTAGLSINADYAVTAEDTTSFPNTTYRDVYSTNGAGGSGDYAGTAKEWENGANSKLWAVQFNANGYTNLHISSKQRSGGNNPGPRDWKLQCAYSGEDWVDIPGGEIICTNDWEGAAVVDLPLPADFNNPGDENIYVRWIMTSDTSISGELVLSNGVNKIDDIIITGQSSMGIEHSSIFNAVHMGPNPANNFVDIRSEFSIQSLEIHDLTGAVLVHQTNVNLTRRLINTSHLPSGIYILQIQLESIQKPFFRKLIIE